MRSYKDLCVILETNDDAHGKALSLYTYDNSTGKCGTNKDSGIQVRNR